MTAQPLTRILAKFKREPSRTGSLLITFYGDAILPRGGSVWMGTLLKFFDLLDTDGGVVRTAISRLAADGWFDREKIGRKSFYRLGASARERFHAAVTHVYNPHLADSDDKLELLLISNGADREAMRAALTEAGFGTPMPGAWVVPAGAAIPSIAASAIHLTVSATDAMGRRLIRESWALDEIAASYRDFQKTFAPLENWVAGSRELAPQDAMLARILLVHHYRHVILRDPLLPSALLPAAWPAPEARAFCGRIYHALLPASEHWLDLHGESVTGALPASGPELTRRFHAG